MRYVGGCSITYYSTKIEIPFGLSKQEVPLEFSACQGIYLLFIILSANAISDGDKESECDEDGPSPEDSRKVNDTFNFGTY